MLLRDRLLRRGVGVLTWISTKVSLPPDNVPVLICREKELGVLMVEQARFEGKMGGKLPWKVFGTRVALGSVSHWMPMPEPPEVET